MKNDQYKAVLEKQLIPQMADLSKNIEKILFMHDGIPDHSAKTDSFSETDKIK